MNLKPILHYALGLLFGMVCEQKREQKHEKNATSSIQNTSETKHTVIRPLYFFISKTCLLLNPMNNLSSYIFIIIHITQMLLYERTLLKCEKINKHDDLTHIGKKNKHERSKHYFH